MDRSCSVSDDIGSSILLRGNKGVRIADFSFNEGHMNSFFAKLFEVQSDLLLVFYNSIHQVICETDFLEVFHLLQHADHSHMYV